MNTYGTQEYSPSANVISMPGQQTACWFPGQHCGSAISADATLRCDAASVVVVDKVAAAATARAASDGRPSPALPLPAQSLCRPSTTSRRGATADIRLPPAEAKGDENSRRYTASGAITNSTAMRRPRWRPSGLYAMAAVSRRFIAMAARRLLTATELHLG